MPRKAYWKYNDFDGRGTIHGVVYEEADDHVIMTADGVNYWLDMEDKGISWDYED